MRARSKSQPRRRPARARSRLGVAAAALASLCACADAPAPRGPNVLLVSFDTTRVDAVGCYGGPAGATPTIDAFAAEGVRFEQAFTPAPLTLPAHASLLTGLNPDRHGVRSNESYALPPAELTLAEILGEEGWDTAAFVGSAVLDAQYGLAQGFATYDDELDPAARDVTRVAERPADAVTERLLAWLDSRDGARPFFVWLHYYDPHYPHELRPGQAARFDSVYHDEVAFADAQLGRVRARLAERGALDDTLVVITADHGEGQGEHGEDTHGYFLYQGTQHVPLVIAHPRLAGGRTDARPASLVDVVPTVLAFVGLEAPATSGLDLLAPGAGARGPLYMEAELGRIDFGLTPLRGAVEGGFKLIDAPRPEFYDLSQDPRELDDLAVEDAERVAELRAWLRGRPRLERRDARFVPDAETSARLRGLGYAGGAADAEPTRDDWTPEQVVRWGRLLTTGLRHFQLGELPRAVEFLRPLVAECPECFAGQRYLGMALARSGELEQGLAHLEAAARLQPDGSSDLWWNVAVGRALAGREAGARAALERTVELEPHHPRALQKLAELCLKAGERDAARKHLEALVDSAPTAPEGRWARQRLDEL